MLVLNFIIQCHHIMYLMDLIDNATTWKTSQECIWGENKI